MPYPLKESYRKGSPISDIPARDLSTIAKTLNDLNIIGLRFKKTGSGLGWEIELMVDGTTLTLSPDNVLSVKANGVDKTKIAADVAGAGLGQNADGSLEVNTDGVTLEVASDSLRIKALGVDTAQIMGGAVTSAKTTGASGSADTGIPGTTLTITNGLVTAIT